MTRPAAFQQQDVTRLLKSFVAAGLPVPKVVIEAGKITAIPVTELDRIEKTPLDRKYGV